MVDLLIVLLSLGGIALVIATSLMPSVIATTRGHSFPYWLVVTLALNPLIALFVLAALPDRTLDRRRARERALLDQQLAAAGRGPGGQAGQVKATSLGDASTVR